MQPLLNTHQVAAIIGLHVKKVQRLARTGALPCIKFGAVYRFRVETLEAWMERNEISERKSTQAGPELGVPVQGLRGRAEAEDPSDNHISYGRRGKDFPPEPRIQS